MGLTILKPVLGALLAGVSVSAFAGPPKCVYEGTRSEGWKLEDGSIQWAECANRISFCGARGSKSEGWYSAEVEKSELIAYANCSTDEGAAPECVNVGTRSEGWKVPNGQVTFASCARKVAACRLIGTRSEGWYAVTPNYDTLKRIVWANCAR